MKASILSIGDEILNGSTLDTNSVFIAENAIKEGLEIDKMLSVSDTKQAITGGLDFLSKTADIIFITGGLGPTKDDITIKTLAEYLGQKLVFNQENYDHVTKLLSKRRNKKVEIDKDRCMFPEQTVFLRNQKGTAPGMWFKKDNTVMISMPGVPLEMKQIFIDEALPKVKSEFNISSLINRYVLTAGIWESFLAKEIEDIENSLPNEISLAYLPKLGQVKLRLTGRNTNVEAVEKYQKLIAERVKDYVFSFDEKESLESALGKILSKKGKTVTLAESCTGGKIAHKITSIAGSSAYYNGSIVSYSNHLKHGILKVDNEIFKTKGAVSEECVLAMAEGVLNFIKADYSIAVSGIAGPTGGTEEKPVGTVWIAVSDGKETIAKQFNFWPFRAENIELASVAALNMLIKFIK